MHRKSEEEMACQIVHNGCCTREMAVFASQYVRDANQAIIGVLRAQGRLWNRVEYEHEYPDCWRSDTGRTQPRHVLGARLLLARRRAQLDQRRRE